MQRNGKLPHATTAVLELPATQVQGADSLVQGTDSLVQAMDNSMQVADGLMQGTDSPAQGTDSPARLSKQSLTIYRSEDALERRLMAASLTLETLLGDSAL